MAPALFHQNGQNILHEQLNASELPPVYQPQDDDQVEFVVHRDRLLAVLNEVTEEKREAEAKRETEEQGKWREPVEVRSRLSFGYEDQKG